MKRSIFDALKQFQLDLVIGGLTQNKRLSQVAAPTKPYFKSRSTVGFPASEPQPSSLEGLTVAVPTVNHLSKVLRERGAHPQKYDNVTGVNGALAGPDWRLGAHGFEPGPWTLVTDKHVFALPKGENGWMLTVQRHLNGLTGLAERLQQLEAER